MGNAGTDPASAHAVLKLPSVWDAVWMAAGRTAALIAAATDARCHGAAASGSTSTAGSNSTITLLSAIT